MRIRRTLVWIMSTLLGALLSIGTLVAFSESLSNISIGSSLLIFLSFGSLAFLWLDYFFKTEYLRT